MSTIKISQLGNLTTIQGNTIVPVVGTVAGTLTTLRSNVAQLQTYILGTVVTDLANLAVSTTANAAVQSVAIAGVTTAWQANAVTQLSQIEGANAAIVTANTALKGYVDAQDTVISNSVTGANAAIVTANTAMKGYVDAVTTAWEANAGIQSASINNITNGTATFGNLVPGANVTYSLGSETAQWKDLYLSGSTIYIGGATLSVANGAIESSLPISANLTATNITVQGTRIAFASGGYIEESEVLDGNLEPAGYYGVSVNSSDDGIISMNALDSNAAVMSSVFVTNVSVQLNVASSVVGDPAHIWYFDNTGAVTFPDTTIQTTAWTGFVDAANVTSLSNVAVSGDYNDLVANVPVLSNVAITGEYSDLANVPNLSAISDITNGTATFGNIIPSANVTYSLGSETAQWKDIWVSGNTIHIGGSQLSIAGNSLSINGSQISTQKSAPGNAEGAVGDTVGDIAFTDSHIYYCKQNFAGVVTYSGIASQNTGAANGRIFNTVGTGGQLGNVRVGWTITGPNITGYATITQINYAGVNEWEFVTNQTNADLRNQTGYTFSGQPGIWVRSAMATW